MATPGRASTTTTHALKSFGAMNAPPPGGGRSPSTGELHHGWPGPVLAAEAPVALGLIVIKSGGQGGGGEKRIVANLARGVQVVRAASIWPFFFCFTVLIPARAGVVPKRSLSRALAHPGGMKAAFPVAGIVVQQVGSAGLSWATGWRKAEGPRCWQTGGTPAWLAQASAEEKDLRKRGPWRNRGRKSRGNARGPRL